MMVQSILQFGMFPIFDGVDFDNSDCIVMWGCNTMWTEATYTSGQVGRSRDRGAKLIVIDPFFEHPLAAKADHFAKTIRVFGKDLTGEQRDKLIAVAARCPVQRTLEGTPVITTLAAG